MKKQRLQKIIELVEKYEIETQGELAERLREEGFDVTQATVSRDIRRMKLSKVATEDGRQKYKAVDSNVKSLEDKYVSVCKEAYVSIDMAQNILVMKTVPGMAMAVAAAVDAMELKEVVGTIAGDDTVMMAVRSVEETKDLMRRLKIMFEK